MEKTLNEQESLKIITEMIENSKMKFKENGFFYLLWGWLVAVAVLSNFIFILIHYKYSWIAWPVLMGAGLIISFTAGYRKTKRTGASTYLSNTLKYFWLGFVVMIFIILFTGSQGYYGMKTAYSLIIALYGFSTFTTGGILNFKPLILGGIINWTLSVVNLFVPEIYSLLTITVAVIVAYLIPGYILNSKAKK